MSSACVCRGSAAAVRATCTRHRVESQSSAAPPRRRRLTFRVQCVSRVHRHVQNGPNDVWQGGARLLPAVPGDRAEKWTGAWL